MPTRIDALPDSALLLVHDSAFALPVVEGANRQVLEADAEAGRLFFLATEDPIRFRVHVYVGEAPPAELESEFEPLGGSFLLEAPTGLLTVVAPNPTVKSAAPSISVPRGPHILTVMGRRPFDGRRHGAEMVTLLGEADWRFSQRTNWLGLLGCLPLLLALGSLLFAIRHGRWRGFLLYALPLALLAWVPHLLLRRSSRYQRIERLMREHEAAKPLFILSLVPTERVSGLRGGFLNVQGSG
ncbi:MAG TPA: hypothetical protein VI669_18880 [Vicinamibacteria bacterium]